MNRERTGATRRAATASLRPRSLTRAGVVMAVAVMLTVFMPGTAGAQQAPTLTSVTLTPDTATIGDRLTLTIDVDHADGFAARGPGFGESYGPFELLEIMEPQREPNGALVRTTLSYTLTTFRTGTVELPPLPIEWSGASGSGTLFTPEQRVTVRSVLLPGEAELRPLKPQLDIAPPAPSAIWPAGFVAIFAALTVAGYWLMRRAVQERPPARPGPAARPSLPHERARAALDQLATRGPEEDPKERYAALAVILRRYLSERFGFPAYAMTRRELQRHTSRAGIDRWPARLTTNLLEQCDAVQFAGFRPAPERMDADLTAAYEIVELTTPGGPAPSTGTASATTMD